MLIAVTGVLLILTGALCLAGGYAVGCWRERSLLRRELAVEEIESRERFMELLESLVENGGERRDQRLN